MPLWLIIQIIGFVIMIVGWGIQRSDGQGNDSIGSPIGWLGVAVVFMGFGTTLG